MNTKFLRPVAESMDDFGGKDVDSGDYVSREEWARSNLTWSAEMGMFEIPGTGYIPHGDEGCVEHANHLYFVRNFPNLVERPEQGYNKVFLPADQVEEMPRWNPFREAVERAWSREILDDDIMSEVQPYAIERVWRREVGKEFADALFAKFGSQLKSVTPLKDVEDFVYTAPGFTLYNQALSDIDGYWDTERAGDPAPTGSAEEVVQDLSWDHFMRVFAPDTNQGKFNFGPEDPGQGQLSLNLESEEDEISDYMKADKTMTPEEAMKWFEEEVPFDEPDGMYLLAAYGPFSGGVLDQANAEYWRKHYEGFVTSKPGVSARSGSVGVKPERLDSIDPDTFERFKHDWQRLQNYPALDERRYSELEQEKRREAYDDWIWREVQNRLVHRFPGMEEALDDLDFKSDGGYSLFEEARDLAGEEWSEQSGGDQSIHIDPVVAAMTPEMVQRWLFGDQQPPAPVEEAKSGYRIKPGATYWFEYHCEESPSSRDAEVWYHSHQKVKVLEMTQPGDGRTEKERVENGHNAHYRIVFSDGFETEAGEDELGQDRSFFCRPDPPSAPMAEALDDDLDIKAIAQFDPWEIKVNRLEPAYGYSVMLDHNGQHVWGPVAMRRKSTINTFISRLHAAEAQDPFDPSTMKFDAWYVSHLPKPGRRLEAAEPPPYGIWPLDESRKYSCLTAPAPPELASVVIQWGKMNVPDDEIYDDENNDFGREGDIHVTVKFGLHEAMPGPELLAIIEQTQPFEIEIGPASLFEGDQYDVLKFDVDSDALRALNERVSQLPHTDTHPEYHPHLTVAYIQRGTCHELIGKPLLDPSASGELRFLVKSVLFSGKGEDRRKVRLFLGKPNELTAE